MSKDIKENSYPYDSGLSRREFLTQAGAASLLAGLLISKPCFAKTVTESSPPEIISDSFSEYHKVFLQAVQLQLFPADADGPSAAEINAFRYLDWALEDPENKADGDRDFIRQGISELESLAGKTYQQQFVKLASVQQHKLIQQFSATERGDSWISLLVYYLIEALLLDPVYGGNTNEVGWKWLQHQPGFPRPTPQRNYRHYV